MLLVFLMGRCLWFWVVGGMEVFLCCRFFVIIMFIVLLSLIFVSRLLSVVSFM